VAREAYSLLKESGLNFIGNVEGNAVLAGSVNVIVCDGFVGNAIMKLCEGSIGAMGDYFKSRMKSHPLIGRLLKGRVKGLLKSLVLSDSAGGGLIWGIDGVVLKIHGHSQAAEVTTKLGQARLAVERGVVDCVKTELNRMIEHTN
jgi:glycerol-3-phosphate acyltransferase PlsX